MLPKYTKVMIYQFSLKRIFNANLTNCSYFREKDIVIS